MMSKQISSFRDVQIIKNNTLVLCDIDDTVLHYPGWKSRCLDIIKDLQLFQLSKEELKKDLNDFCNMYKHMHKPEHTDYDGFSAMLQNIQSHQGKLLFITARCKVSHETTKKHLMQAGVYCDDQDIHYTDNIISKGEYIQKNIDISQFDDVIFIDDYVSYIKSVVDIFPQITCYQFCGSNVDGDGWSLSS